MRLIARIDPRLWEVIVPPQPPWLRTEVRGPFPQPWRDAVEQGPIPDPWIAAADDLQLYAQIQAADLARRVVDAASAASVQGADGPAVIARTIDQWVKIDDGDGTGHLPFPFPFPSPWAVKPPRPPRPNELIDLGQVLTAAALSFATLGETIQDPGLSSAIEHGVETIATRVAALDVSRGAVRASR
ncbi:MAG: hypothetical protein HYZ38_14485 [Mycobacterium sp.]|nr:hypothetical protein [Mycobacterium sp.]